MKRSNQIDLGLLILRIGIGLSFFLHGYPKVTGGPEMWEKIGGSMGNIGIHFAPVFWGFMASIAECFGGLLLSTGIGIVFRPVCAMMAFTMLIAIIHHATSGDGFNGYSHALEDMVVFIALLVSGPGKYQLFNKDRPLKIDI